MGAVRRHIGQVGEAALAVALHPALRLAGVRRVGVGEADEQEERLLPVALAQASHGAVGEVVRLIAVEFHPVAPVVERLRAEAGVGAGGV